MLLICRVRLLLLRIMLRIEQLMRIVPRLKGDEEGACRDIRIDYSRLLELGFHSGWFEKVKWLKQW